MTDGTKTLVSNRKAWHEFFIEESYEAGLELKGTEVKSVRLGRANMADGYCQVKNGEMWLLGMHISPYEKGNIYNVDPIRNRRLLLHHQEIMRLTGLSQKQGFSLIPLRLYLKKGKVKLELGVAKGKKLYDKRQDLHEKAITREMERAFSDRQRSE